MRVIAKRTLREYWENHHDCRNALETWYKMMSNVTCQTPNDLEATFPRCSILSDNRAVFRIKGNSYRLVVEIDYKFLLVFIRFIGTHAEYDKIDATII